MADRYTIEAPVTLCQLPRPIDALSGRTLSGPSHTISGSRKRKRTELVIGSDGESVNVYDVKAPRLVVSHAIPPQARLTAPPCCVYTKNPSEKSSTRYTYAALRNDLRGKRQQVLCYTETTGRPSQDPNASSSTTGQHTWEASLESSTVTHIEAVSGEVGSHQIAVIHEDGHVRGLTADMQKELWNISVGGDQATLFTFVQTAAEARQGLLKNREDLLASLDTSGGRNQAETFERTTIISIVTSNKKDQASGSHHTLHVMAIKPESVELQAQLSKRAHLLISWGLPQSPENDQKVQYSFDRSSGTLYRLNNDTLSSFTFATLGPRMLYQLAAHSGEIFAFLSMPQSQALVTTATNCTLFNMRYSSVQATRCVTSTDASRLGRKRKHSETETASSSAPIILLDYFRRQGLAVGIQRHELVGFQLREPNLQRGSQRRQESRLIDSLGRGVGSKGEGIERATAGIDADKVDELARADSNLSTLSDIYTKPERPYVSLSGLIQSLKYVLRSFSTPSIPPQPRLPPANAAKLNGVNGTKEVDAEVDQADPLEATLQAEEAAADADLSLAISLITSSALTTSQPTADSALSSTSATEATVSLTSRALTLQVLLTRLGTCHPPASLSRALRTQLSRHDLFLLIELLRHALEQGGWASKVLDVYPTEEDAEAAKGAGGLDESVKVIGVLLNCAVDALGAGAWLTGGVDVNVDPNLSLLSSSDDEDDKNTMDVDGLPNPTQQPLLTHLRHLTTSVLEVTQEAAFFRGFLHDFLRYSDALLASPAANRLTASAHLQNIKDNALATVEGRMLPMGVAPARGIEKTRVAAGGEVKARSRRDLADRLHRGVGSYAFERIMI